MNQFGATINSAAENILVQESWHMCVLTYLQGMNGAALLSHSVCLCSGFIKNAKLFSKEVVTIYIPTHGLWEFLLFHSLSKLGPSNGQGWVSSSPYAQSYPIDWLLKDAPKHLSIHKIPFCL